LGQYQIWYDRSKDEIPLFLDEAFIIRIGKVAGNLKDLAGNRADRSALSWKYVENSRSEEVSKYLHVDKSNAMIRFIEIPEMHICPQELPEILNGNSEAGRILIPTFQTHRSLSEKL